MTVTFLRCHLVPAVKMVAIFKKVNWLLYMFSLLAWGDMFLYTLWLICWVMSTQTVSFCFLCMLDNIKNRRLQCGWLISIILGSFGSFWLDSNQKPAWLDSKGVLAKFQGANGLNKYICIYLLNFIFFFCYSEPTKKGFSLLSVLKR